RGMKKRQRSQPATELRVGPRPAGWPELFLLGGLVILGRLGWDVGGRGAGSGTAGLRGGAGQRRRNIGARGVARAAADEDSPFFIRAERRAGGGVIVGM